MIYLVVFVGGCVGTGMRYGLSQLIPAAESGAIAASFHLATFVANMAACFIYAALTTYMSQASWIRKRIRQLTSRGVGMGMCGGFSTLSAMVIEELTSLRQGYVIGFAIYMLVSFAGGWRWRGTARVWDWRPAPSARPSWWPRRSRRSPAADMRCRRPW